MRGKGRYWQGDAALQPVERLSRGRRWPGRNRPVAQQEPAEVTVTVTVTEATHGEHRRNPPLGGGGCQALLFSFAGRLGGLGGQPWPRAAGAASAGRLGAAEQRHGAACGADAEFARGAALAARRWLAF